MTDQEWGQQPSSTPQHSGGGSPSYGPLQPLPLQNEPSPQLPQQPPYSQQSHYPQQLPYRQQPYVQPVPAGYRPGKRRRLGVWLGIGGGVMALVIVVAVAAVVITFQHRSGGGAPGGLDASACPTPAKSAVGPGPWQMIVPRTLCGLPVDRRGQQSGQANLSSTEGLLNINNIVFKTGVDEGYETPNGSNATAYRFIIYQGFTGSFNQAQAASVLESGDEETFHPVSPGPHGGIMACAQPYPNSADCVWATSTTLGDIDIEDTSLDLVGAHADANAIRIRDVVEVAPGSTAG